jgi:hypothetical protein
VSVDVRVVGIAGPVVDYPTVIVQHLRESGLRGELCSIPFSRVWGSRLSLLREVRRELRKTPPSAISIYCAGLTEMYVKEADLSLHFSAFRNWFDPRRMRVMPHHWAIAEPIEVRNLVWREKPPLTIGFMGTGYVNSRMGRLISSMHIRVKERILSGRHLKFAGAIAALQTARIPVRYAMTFPRAETIRMIERAAPRIGADVQIVDTGGFTGSREQVEQYLRHLEDVTYVLCPRGIENFSYRFYEALKFGRVPVLIDTHMMLPDGVDWDELIIRVPYTRLADIGEIIRQDYENRSSADFLARQHRAFRTMADLQSGSWVNRLVDDVRSRLAAKSSRIQTKVLDSAVTV